MVRVKRETHVFVSILGDQHFPGKQRGKKETYCKMCDLEPPQKNSLMSWPLLSNLLSQFCQRTAAWAVTWPCLQRRGSPCDGPAPGNRTVTAGAHASCSLLATTPALQMEGCEKQVTAWGKLNSFSMPLILTLSRYVKVRMNLLFQSFHQSFISLKGIKNHSEGHACYCALVLTP